jgi:hypothetical protein
MLTYQVVNMELLFLLLEPFLPEIGANLSGQNSALLHKKLFRS